MKMFGKSLGIIIILAIIGFTMASCDLFGDNFELFNGDWERVGLYVVTFNNGNGVFKELNGGIWSSAKNAGQINIGEQCYRNFKKSSDNEWTGEIRIYNSSSPHQTLRWESCTIKLDDQTLRVSTSSTGSFNLTKK